MREKITSTLTFFFSVDLEPLDLDPRFCFSSSPFSPPLLLLLPLLSSPSTETNVCYNCVDRHVEAGLGDRVAFLFEGNDLDKSSTTTYSQLQDQVVRIANWLRSNGVGKGDDVTLYMPMVPELPAAMLACARVGAVHSVVFGGFSADALAARISDSKSRIVLTASAVRRGAKPIPLKTVVDAAIAKCAKSAEPHKVERVLVLDKPEAAARSDTLMVSERDQWWQDALAQQPAEDTAPIEWVEAEHPLFKLYTSGSTGKPKGVIHSTAGYMASVVKIPFSFFFPVSSCLFLGSFRCSFTDALFFSSSTCLLRLLPLNSIEKTFLKLASSHTQQKTRPQKHLKKTSKTCSKKNTQVGTATTFKHVFDHKAGSDVYWCTADCGWITGHSYVTYGPLLHAATQVKRNEVEKKKKREVEVELEESERIFFFGDFSLSHFFSLPRHPKNNNNRSSSKACPLSRTQDACGRSSPSTRSPSSTPRPRPSEPWSPWETTGSECTTGPLFAFWVPSGSRSARRRGTGTTGWWERGGARSWTRGGRRRRVRRFFGF